MYIQGDMLECRHSEGDASSTGRGMLSNGREFSYELRRTDVGEIGKINTSGHGHIAQGSTGVKGIKGSGSVHRVKQWN